MSEARSSSSRDIEWPTILLALGIHAGWALATWFHDRLPIWLLIPAGGWFVAWHGSLQHETIHGHPTRHPGLNALIGSLPMSLWLPYRCYRREHLTHHQVEIVTHPSLDPEARYLAPPSNFADRVRIALAHVQATLPGRMVLGPPLVVATFLLGELRRLLVSPQATVRDWGPHLAGVAIVVLWLAACRFPLAPYLATFVYPGMALTLLRSFAEHRAARIPEHRVAIVEGGGPLALLYLNNNLHAVHHRSPGLAWFRLPAFYRHHRAEILAGNGGLLYRSYGDVVRRFWRRPHDMVIHPDFA